MSIFLPQANTLGTPLYTVVPRWDSTKQKLAIMKVHASISSFDQITYFLNECCESEVSSLARHYFLREGCWQEYRFGVLRASDVWDEMQRSKDPILMRVVAMDPGRKEVREVFKMIEKDQRKKDKYDAAVAKQNEHKAKKEAKKMAELRKHFPEAQDRPGRVRAEIRGEVSSRRNRRDDDRDKEAPPPYSGY